MKEKEMNDLIELIKEKSACKDFYSIIIEERKSVNTHIINNDLNAKDGNAHMEVIIKLFLDSITN